MWDDINDINCDIVCVTLCKLQNQSVINDRFVNGNELYINEWMYERDYDVCLLRWVGGLMVGASVSNAACPKRMIFVSDK